MKIAFIYDAIYPYVIGGVEKRIFDLANKLSRRHEVHLLGMKYWQGDAIKKRGRVTLHGVCKPLPLYNRSGRRTIFQPLYFSFFLIKALWRQHFDVIECQNFPYFPCFVVKGYSLIRQKPFIIIWHEVWHDYWEEYLGRWKGKIGKLIEKLLIHLTPHHIAVSKDTAQRLSSLLKLKNVRVIPIGVDCHHIEKLSASQQAFDLLFVGRLVKNKNIDCLIKAVKLVESTCGIVGEGPEYERLKILSAELGLDNKIKFFPFFASVEEMYPLLKSAKLCILPSIREGFSIVMIESIACNTPMILVRHPQSVGCDVLETLNLSCAADPDDLAHKIRWSFENYGSIVSQLQKRRGQFLEQYDMNKVIKMLEEYYVTV